MAPNAKESPSLRLAFIGKDAKGSPRAYDPPSSHRLSVASTGVGDVYTPLLLSPEVSYRSAEPSISKAPATLQGAIQPLPAPGRSPRKGQAIDTPRRVVRVRGEPTSEDQSGRTQISPDIVFAKKNGHALPPLKEVRTSMLDEGISRTSSQFSVWHYSSLPNLSSLI